MFFDVFSVLCEQRGISRYKACTDVGLNRAAVAKWKKGSIPNGATLKRLADYFNVTPDYLMGLTVEAQIAVAESKLRYLQAVLDFSECQDHEEIEQQIEAVSESLADLRVAKQLTAESASVSMEGNVELDDFTFAMQHEGKTLTEMDKQILISMAKQLNEARKNDGGNV